MDDKRLQILIIYLFEMKWRLRLWQSPEKQGSSAFQPLYLTPVILPACNWG